MPKQPSAVAETMKIDESTMQQANCSRSLEEAKNFDEKLVERWSLRLGLSAIVGPISWPISLFREIEHKNDRDMVIAALERDCNTKKGVDTLKKN